MRHNAARDIFTPFELAQWVWVRHDKSLDPEHQKVGWDKRCRACLLSQEYLSRVSMAVGVQE